MARHCVQSGIKAPHTWSLFIRMDCVKVLFTAGWLWNNWREKKILLTGFVSKSWHINQLQTHTHTNTFIHTYTHTPRRLGMAICHRTGSANISLLSSVNTVAPLLFTVWTLLAILSCLVCSVFYSRTVSPAQLKVLDKHIEIKLTLIAVSDTGSH